LPPATAAARPAPPGPAPWFCDSRAEPLGAAAIAERFGRLGEREINRAATTWRGLREAEGALPRAGLRAGHPAVMERPVNRQEGRLWLGLPRG
jgi:hypothetical protein